MPNIINIPLFFTGITISLIYIYWTRAQVVGNGFCSSVVEHWSSNPEDVGFDSQPEGLGVAFFATGPGLGLIMYILSTLEFPTHNLDFHLFEKYAPGRCPGGVVLDWHACIWLIHYSQSFGVPINLVRKMTLVEIGKFVDVTECFLSPLCQRICSTVLLRLIDRKPLFE